MEGLVRLARAATSPPQTKSSALKNLFILRNNDLGDVLLTTPLLAALKKWDSGLKIHLGVGDWARPILENNPHVEEVLSVNAPWHNKFVKPQGLVACLGYAGNANLEVDIECGPCWIHTSHGQVCSHGVKCMERISVDRVQNAVQEILTRQAKELSRDGKIPA